MRQHIRYGLDNVVRGIAERSEQLEEEVAKEKPKRRKAR
jgi:hypothetical protein